MSGAGSISSSIRDQRGTLSPINYAKPIWDYQSESKQVPYTISSRPFTREDTGRQRMMEEASLSAFKKVSGSSQLKIPLFRQQDKILVSIPRIKNDKYVLDVENVSVGKLRMPGISEPLDDGYLHIKSNDFVNSGRPSSYGTGFNNTNRFFGQTDRPQVSVDSRNVSNPLFGLRTVNNSSPFKSYGSAVLSSSNIDRRVNMSDVVTPSLHIPQSVPRLPQGEMQYQKAPLREMLIEPERRMTAGFALYGRASNF